MTSLYDDTERSLISIHKRHLMPFCLEPTGPSMDISQPVVRRELPQEAHDCPAVDDVDEDNLTLVRRCSHSVRLSNHYSILVTPHTGEATLTTDAIRLSNSGMSGNALAMTGLFSDDTEDNERERLGLNENVQSIQVGFSFVEGGLWRFVPSSNMKVIAESGTPHESMWQRGNALIALEHDVEYYRKGNEGLEVAVKLGDYPRVAPMGANDASGSNGGSTKHDPESFTETGGLNTFERDQQRSD